MIFPTLFGHLRMGKNKGEQERLIRNLLDLSGQRLGTKRDIVYKELR